MKRFIPAIIGGILLLIVAGLVYFSIAKYHQANSRLIFPLSPGDEVAFLASWRSGLYAVSSVKEPNPGTGAFSAYVEEIAGVEIRITQGEEILLEGAFQGLERFPITGYKDGPVRVNMAYDDNESGDIFIVFGKPL